MTDCVLSLILVLIEPLFCGPLDYKFLLLSVLNIALLICCQLSCEGAKQSAYIDILVVKIDYKQENKVYTSVNEQKECCYQNMWRHKS